MAASTGFYDRFAARGPTASGHGLTNLRSCRPAPHPNRTDRGAGASTDLRSTRRPPLNSRIAARVLHSGGTGPVERPHGFQRRIAAACPTDRSGIQPFASAAPQGSWRIAVPGAWRFHVDDGRGQCANAPAATLGDCGEDVLLRSQMTVHSERARRSRLGQRPTSTVRKAVQLHTSSTVKFDSGRSPESIPYSRAGLLCRT
jgi:hypothetical protein